MNPTLPKKPRIALKKLADFQRVVIGDWDLLQTEGLRAKDIRHIGLGWAGYIFRCSWENGMTTISAICPRSEYMAVYIFADRHSFDLHLPARTEDSEDAKEEKLPCEPYHLLGANIALRLAQLGLAQSINATADHLDQFREYPVNFQWSEMLLRSVTKDSETEILYGIDKTGKKAVVYVNSADGTRLNPRLVEYPDHIHAEDLRLRHEQEIRDSVLYDEFLGDFPKSGTSPLILG